MIKQANANKYVNPITSVAVLLPVTRHALHQLQDRCLSFLVIVQQTGDGAPAQEQQRLIAGVEGSVLHTPSPSVNSDDNLVVHFAA